MAESHVVSALKAKRAEIAGEAEAVERRLTQLRADLVHVDAVLRMFAPGRRSRQHRPQAPLQAQAMVQRRW